MAGPFILGEALVLGLASGPACIASCGPVVVPSLLAEHAGIRLNTRYLSTFLGARFLGYLLFCCRGLGTWRSGIARAGATHGPDWRDSYLAGWRAALVRITLPGMLVRSGVSGSGLVSIGVTRKRGVPGAAALGFLTGLSLCPPFVAAGVRAAELGSVAAALLFFAVFFIGTSVWFVPFVGLGCVARNEAVTTVARMAMVLISLYYAYLGMTILLGRKVYGY